MKKSLIILSLILAFLNTKCTSDYHKETKGIKGYISNINNEGKQMYILIPTHICNQCIKNLIQYLNVIEKPKISVIFISETNKDIYPFSRYLSNKYKIIKETKNKYLKKLDYIVIAIKKKNNIVLKKFPENNFFMIKKTIHNFDNL